MLRNIIPMNKFGWHLVSTLQRYLIDNFFYLLVLLFRLVFAKSLFCSLLCTSIYNNNLLKRIEGEYNQEKLKYPPKTL